MHVQFDSSTLVTVLGDDDNVKELIATIQRKNHTASISKTALEEVAAVGSPALAIARARRLLHLTAALGHQFYFALGARATWRLELSQRIRAPVPICKDENGAVLRFLNGLIRGSEKIIAFQNWQRKNITSWKDTREMRSRDERSVLQHAFKRQGLTAKRFGVYLDTFTPDKIPQWFYEATVHQALNSPRYPVHLIYTRHGRYRSIRAWAALAILTMVSDALPSDHLSQHPITQWLKKHKNNWYDAQVAAAAGYADIFVVDDKNLTARCRWLHEHQCIRYKTMDFATYLSTSQTDTAA